MNMGARIKQKRKELCLTQEELGKRVGLQKSAIAKYENGRVENMKRSMIEKMSNALSCSPTWLLGVEEAERHVLTDQQKRIIDYLQTLSPEDQNMIEKMARTMSLDNENKNSA